MNRELLKMQRTRVGLDDEDEGQDRGRVIITSVQRSNVYIQRVHQLSPPQYPTGERGSCEDDIVWLML